MQKNHKKGRSELNAHDKHFLTNHMNKNLRGHSRCIYG